MATKDGAEQRALPKKEADLFRATVKFYETKQYKKGLKSAESVLKKFPNHGETLAMRGLLMNCLDRKEEAHENVKRGLAVDVRSHVCWHVYGLLHRSERNYPMAIKCYLNALRIDTGNRQILRDLALLQIQMRDLKGYLETKRKILLQQPNNRVNWVSYAVAYHLYGHPAMALEVLTKFLLTQKDRSEEEAASERYEDSELLLYFNLIKQEQGKYQEALDHLEESRPKIVDHLALRQKRAELLLFLGRFEEARAQIRDLLTLGPDNYDWHRIFQCAVLQAPQEECKDLLALKRCDLPSTVLALTDEQIEALKVAYSNLVGEGLKGLALMKIPLTFLTEDELKHSLKAFIEHGIRKGIPGLGVDLSSLYFTTNEDGRKTSVKDPYDLRTNPTFNLVSEIVDEIIASLQATSRFSGAQDEMEPEGPSCLLWAMYLKVQIHEMRAELAEAQVLINQCIEHTPTAIHMYLRKGRILKKMGDLQEAADVVNQARQLDLSDRYINNKATKYLLRADRLQQAQDTIALFTRHEGDPQHNLYEMQCSWYELEWAASQKRLGNLPLALKKLAAVEKHFHDFQEDQFDFHTYCMRKCTLRSYVDTLRWEDTVFNNSFYARAAEGLVTVYLSLLEKPETTDEASEPDYSSMTPAERKKAKALARKLAKQEEKKKDQTAGKSQSQHENPEKAANSGSNQAIMQAEDDKDEKKKKPNARLNRPVPVDDDPLGEKLAAKDPLTECSRYISVLQRHAPKAISTHILAFDIAMKKGKILQALQALVRGSHLQHDHAELLLRTVIFLEHLHVPQIQTLLNPTVSQVIQLELEMLTAGKSLEQFIEDMCATAVAQASLLSRVAAAKALHSLNPSNSQRASALILEGLHGRDVNFQTCQKAVEALTTFAGNDLETASFREQVSVLFPQCKGSATL